MESIYPDCARSIEYLLVVSVSEADQQSLRQHSADEMYRDLHLNSIQALGSVPVLVANGDGTEARGE